MKIAITGHTSGIGKALFESFDDVVGFSRSNGYDLNTDIDKIISESLSADIFINNAYCGFRQVELLYQLFKKWKDLDKTIVNISSNSGDGIKKSPHIYAVHKASLDKMSEQLSYQNSKCKIINVRPGWVDTPRVSHINKKKISTQEIAEIIVFLLKTKTYIRKNL